MKPSMSRALLSGLAGTVAVALIACTGYPLVANGEPLDLAGMLGSAFGDDWLAGLIGMFAIGTLILPTLYVGIFQPVLPAGPVAGGIVWGFVVWLLTQAAFVAATGGGLLRWTTGGGPMILGIMIGMLAYGIIFGLFLNGGRRARASDAPALREPEDLRHAS